MAEEDALEMLAMLSRWEGLHARWGLDSDEEAALLGGSAFAGPVGDIESWRSSRMEERMRLLIDLGSGLDALLVDEDRICSWLRRRIDLLGGLTPIEAMSSSIEWIRSLRRAALNFVP